MITDNDIKIEVAGPENLRNAALSVREHVFVKEIGIPKDIEFDGNDGAAVHIIAYIQKQQNIIPVGTMRIRSFAGFVRFERIAVIRDFRKTDVSEAIMQYGFNYVAQKGYRKVGAYCKKELLPRWQSCGFYFDKTQKTIDHNGMKLIPICRDLPPHPRALTMNSDPYLLIAKEGHWFDDAPEIQQPSKSNNILAQLKELKNKCFNR
ncbi:MAG: hypothetical protein IJ099_04040 [Alphaproteobacteria bacterium]|nr:hypothetical protein [Alphaproteobacteria bacterium]